MNITINRMVKYLGRSKKKREFSICSVLLVVLVSTAIRIAAAVEIEITSPEDGTTVESTFTIEGTSIDAVTVSVSVNGGQDLSVNGLEEWNIVFEPESLLEGTNVFTATAFDEQGNQLSDSISIVILPPTFDLPQFTYESSLDGETLSGFLLLPTGFDPNGESVPLLVHLHGGGGTGSGLGNNGVSDELNARGWIGIAPDGRKWGLFDEGCDWQTSAAYVDNIDPNVGPGEQDILDAIDWAVDNFPIDTNRVYLTGFSMGGRGAYIIGLKNPDRFAAIAPRSPAIDMFEIFARRPKPRKCKEGMTGGQPGDSTMVDTMYSITSARFLIENAYNLPVFHGHGTRDSIANNNPDNAPFLHGWHITSDTSWDECFGSAGESLCFGHTPTLSELKERHPDGYDWAFMFSPVSHATDTKWIQGTPISGDILGVEDAQSPGNFIGIMEFFDRHTLLHAPITVVYKTYTDTHRKAYWTEIDTITPWSNIPAAIRATRDSVNNELHVELVRVATATFDLALAELQIDVSRPLTVNVQPLIEPVYDPALQPDVDILKTTLVFRDEALSVESVNVIRDGQFLPDNLIDLDNSQLTIGPIFINEKTKLIINSGTATDDGLIPTKMSVSPQDSRKALRFSDAVVTVLDQNGDGIEGVFVNASADGARANVFPTSAMANEDGIARFQFRFGLFSNDGSITFTADNLKATIESQ